MLVAAFGNELRGDDGFGVAVLRCLEASLREDAGVEVKLLEVGTGGISLAQELLSPCDRLIIVDAVRRGSTPGTLYVLRVEEVPSVSEIDMHLAVPSHALALAKALGALPPETFLVGCEPAEVEELTLELSPPVRDAVASAAHQVQWLMEGRG